MAITKMNKFTLICLRENKQNILKRLQVFGNSELINLQEKKNEDKSPLAFMKEEFIDDELKDIDNKLSIIKSAISFLLPYTHKPSGLKAIKEGKFSIPYDDLSSFVESFEWKEICEELKAKEKRISSIDSELAKVNTKIDLLLPWSNLDITLKEVSKIENATVKIGTVMIKNEKEIELLLKSFEDKSLSEVYIVNNLNNTLHILIYAHNEESEKVNEVLKSFDFMETNILENELIHENLKCMNSLKLTLNDEKEVITKSLSENYDLDSLLKCEEYYENNKVRIASSNNLVGSNETLIISGWIPCEFNCELERLIKEEAEDKYFIDFEEVKEEDIPSVPIKLKNNKFVSAFESITAMYSLPNYNGLDPTPYLAPFYLLFFGMMVADMGYGIIVTLASIIAIKKFSLNESTKDFMKLFMYLGISTTVWGIVFGAGFGDAISFNSLLSQTDDIFMILYLSIGFGVFQILLGLCIKATLYIKSKKYFEAFSEVGTWLITFLGITLILIKNPFGLWIMIIGMISIVVTNGGEAKSVGGKLGNGAYALYGITSYVGDLISYTRLMALGIAGGSIAGAMNLIIGYLPGISMFIIGPVLFILLHIFNLLLSLLGAYVHSCRLQYVEYFGKFYEGSGKVFKPLKMVNKNINVK